MIASRLLVTLCAATVASSFPLAPAHGQTRLTTLTVDDPRPLEAAVLAFLRRYPIVITYEDQRYEFSGDIQDASSLSPRVRHGVVIPRGGLLQANYRISNDSGQPVSPSDAVKNIVEAKNAMPLGGRFEVLQIGSAFHIVPSQVRDSGGRWVEQESILDVPITLSTGELGGYELIEAILNQVKKTSGAPILGLGAPSFGNLLARYRGAVDVKDEPARDVLIDVLQSISPRLTWILNYGPSEHYYIFNLAMAAEPPPKEIPLDLSKFVPPPGAPRPVGREPATQPP